MLAAWRPGPRGGAPVDALGLLGMRERALMVDGTLEIRSVPGNGTTVTLSIPYIAPGNSPAT